MAGLSINPVSFIDLCNDPAEADHSAGVAPGEAAEADHSARADLDLHDGRKPGADRGAKVDQDELDFEHCIKYDRLLSKDTICYALAPEARLNSHLADHYTSMDVVLQPKEGDSISAHKCVLASQSLFMDVSLFYPLLGYFLKCDVFFHVDLDRN